MFNCICFLFLIINVFDTLCIDAKLRHYFISCKEISVFYAFSREFSPVLPSLSVKKAQKPSYVAVSVVFPVLFFLLVFNHKD